MPPRQRQLRTQSSASARPVQGSYLLTRAVFRVRSVRNEWLRVFRFGSSPSLILPQRRRRERVDSLNGRGKESGNCSCYWEEDTREVNSQVRLDTGFQSRSSRGGPWFCTGTLLTYSPTTLLVPSRSGLRTYVYDATFCRLTGFLPLPERRTIHRTHALMQNPRDSHGLPHIGHAHVFYSRCVYGESGSPFLA